jgi:hypothetical protein
MGPRQLLEAFLTPPKVRELSREESLLARSKMSSVRLEGSGFARGGRREQEHRTSLSDHSCKVATLPLGLLALSRVALTGPYSPGRVMAIPLSVWNYSPTNPQKH